MVDITAVQMVTGGTGHEHIQAVRWRNPDTAKAGESTRHEMVSWLTTGKANRAFVVVGKLRVEVFAVKATPPYIRTWADGIWRDNLLALPRY